ncbi:Glucose-6-phosphate isomerase [Bienertia sinuspersici]
MFEVFPRATRRVCAQHLYSNWKGSWPGKEYHDLFWMAANPFVYKKSLNALQKMDPNSAHYLDNVVEKWSKHQFDTLVVNDHNTTNFVESFNSCTKPFRDLPIMTLLEEVRNWQMKRIGSRLDKAVAMSQNDVTEYAARLLDARGDERRLCYIIKAGEFNLPKLQPPPMARTVGRPIKSRKRGKDEPRKAKRSTILKCRKCSFLGHNSRICQGGLMAKQRKEAATTSNDKGKKPTGEYESKRKNVGEGPTKGPTKRGRK